MPKKQKFKTMYMHTLDGRPAGVQIQPDGYPFIHFVTRSPHKVTLVDSLKTIRYQQRLCTAKFGKDGTRYGYVLVRVPA